MKYNSITLKCAFNMKNAWTSLLETVKNSPKFLSCSEEMKSSDLNQSEQDSDSNPGDPK